MRTVLAVAALLLLAIVGFFVLRRKLPVSYVMVAYAKDAVDTAKRSFQVDLDYSEDSVRRLEEIVGKQHEEYAKGSKPSDDDLNTFCKMWGAYLGEVMRKQIGGEWSVPADGPFQGAYTLTMAGTSTSPPAKVYKRIVDGQADDLYFYYRVLLRQAREGVKTK